MIAKIEGSESRVAPQDSRAAPRKQLAIEVILRVEKGKSTRTMLRELSLSGFSASAKHQIAIDTICWLTLPDRQPMQARVVWSKGGLVGCAFNNQIGQVTYDAILERWQASKDRHQ